MGRYCSVPGCRSTKGGHLYPLTPERNMKWRIAVRRIDQVTRKLWMPGEEDVVCGNHFKPEDYRKDKRRRLKDGTVPSVFSFDDYCPVPSKIPRKSHTTKRKACQSWLALDDVASEVVIGEEVKCDDLVPFRADASIQCILGSVTSSYSIQNFQEKDDAVHYLSGFDDYKHFMCFFGILKDAGIALKYKCTSLLLENQLFIVLMKLRQGFDHKFLSILFEISETTVSKVFAAWIRFLYGCMKVLNTWPSKKLVQETMPKAFKKKYPATRIIIDLIEIPIEEPSDINLRHLTFSTRKNRNTLKVLVGITPCGVVSYVGECYGGSTSDREIIEQSDLCTQAFTLFEEGDVILANRDFLVQDLFEPHNVTVNVCNTGEEVAPKRVDVERAIECVDTYKILQSAIPCQLLPLSNKIVYVCFMLTNYRRDIVKD